MDFAIVAAGSAWLGYWWYQDFDNSKRYIYYGRKESTKIFQDKEGYLSLPKVFIGSLIGHTAFAVGAGLVSNALANEQQGNIFWLGLGAYLLSAGTAHMIKALTVRQRMKKSRKAQIAFRKRLQQLPQDLLTISAAIRTLVQNNKSKRWYSPTLGWIRADAQDFGEARLKLAPLYIEWLALPENMAWPDTKFHPKES